MLVRVVITTRDGEIRDKLARACSIPYVLVSATRGDEAVADDYDIAIVDPPGPDRGAREDVAGERGSDRDHGRDEDPFGPTILVAGVGPVDVDDRVPTPGGRWIDVSVSDKELARVLALAVQQRRERIQRQVAPAPRAVPPPDVFVSASTAMHDLLDVLRRVARSESSIMLLGETGTGKERLAALVHQQSPRRDGPFVAINCAAIPAGLFESELFGHRRGAFTGATRDHRGVFEQARGGTLFLDEIAELPLELQPKLLRVLQDRQVRPVGSDRLIETDVRVVSATNRNLKGEADAGRFRPDLYYRLGVVELSVPPLRDRQADIWPLTEAWLAHFQVRLAREDLSLDPSLRAVLETYPWPGNVRELVNIVERAVLLATGPTIGIESLPDALRAEEPNPSRGETASAAGLPDDVVHMPERWLDRPWRAVRDDVLLVAERAYLEGVLVATQGQVGRAARMAGMSERALFEKMRRHGLRKEDFRS